MPGHTPDPADTINVLDVIREAFSQTFKPLSDQMEKVSRTILEAQSSPMHSTVSFGLTPDAQPVVLLGYDRSRVRALVRSSAVDVYVGTLEQLQSRTGYPLPIQAGDEMKTTEEVYVGYYPAGTPEDDVRVFAWIERRV